MDLRTVITISTLLLMTAGLGLAKHPNDTETSFTALNNNNNIICNCSSANITSASPPPPCPIPRLPAPALGFLTITWNKCKGNVYIKNISTSLSLPVCHNVTIVKRLLGNLCQDKSGCEGETKWTSSHNKFKGYLIEKGGSMEETSCYTLMVQCSGEDFANVQGQLQAYKVVTALLCCVLIVLLLIRFTRPTVKALQKRLSDRRQSRWIGPTQSHSVSYHRGKTAVKNDGEKRLSFPALERLTVSNSREPSSNRNSDCNY